MEWYFYLIIAVAVVAVFLLVITAVTTAAVNKIVFGTRQDKNPNFKYFTPDDFGLTVEHMPVRLYGVELAANLYTVKPVEDCEKVVIFQHGFGAGSSGYMTEIAHFAKCGYAVVACDAYGCNNSAGKKIKGFYAGAEAVIAAYIGVNCDNRLKNKPVVLIGHSWGAYSVAAACARIKADGVAAMSGFNKPVQCMGDMLKGMGGVAKFYAPFVCAGMRVINFFKFGAKGNSSAAKAVEKSGVKALLIHGERDGTVKLKHSTAFVAKGKNITSLILADKRHNPYNTAKAEDKLAELTGGHKFESEEQKKAYYENFDWKAATEEDAEVMSQIDGFIESV